MKHLSITITTTTEAADIVSLILIEEGSEGVSVKDSADVREVLSGGGWDYIDEQLLSGNTCNANGDNAGGSGCEAVLVSGVFEIDYDITRLYKKLEEFRALSEMPTGSLDVTAKEIESADYENEWKKFYEVIEVGRLAVVPVWREYSGCLTPILMNPGKAFGTGGHETTYMCLQLMQRLDFTDKRVIDVGTGSGILGIAAVKLGAESCTMIDNDLQATESAAENAELNNIYKSVEITCCTLEAFKNWCARADVYLETDIIIANLTADILIAHKDLFKTVLKNGGSLIVSGIINSRLVDVKYAFSDYKIIEEITKGEWCALLLEI